MCSTDIFLGLIAILFPPFAVWVKAGICSVDSIINIFLCMLGYLPGLLHAWYIIAKFPDPDYTYSAIPGDAEGGNHHGGHVTYVYVTSPSPQPDPRAQPQPKPAQGGNNTGYGTTSNIPQAADVHQQPSGAWANGPSQQPHGESSQGAPPPSYAEVVSAGGHKIQTQD